MPPLVCATQVIGSRLHLDVNLGVLIGWGLPMILPPASLQTRNGRKVLNANGRHLPLSAHGAMGTYSRSASVLFHWAVGVLTRTFMTRGVSK